MNDGYLFTHDATKVSLSRSLLFENTGTRIELDGRDGGDELSVVHLTLSEAKHLQHALDRVLREIEDH